MYRFMGSGIMPDIAVSPSKFEISKLRFLRSENRWTH